MKSTGIVRPVDDLGRIVIPKELRRTMNIAEGSGLEIYVDREQIILKKHERGCTFCGEASEVIDFHGKPICRACASELAGGNRK